MKQQITARRLRPPAYRRLLNGLCALLVLIPGLSGNAFAQAISVDLSSIDGIEISPGNIFNYRIHNTGSKTEEAEITGRVQYRQSGLSFTYKYHLTLQPGITGISKDNIPTPTWHFSSFALKELFFNYAKLPQGTYEYCVTVTLKKNGSLEAPDPPDPEACVYQTVEDMFLIHLVTPENDAKIYEFNPMLAWVVNYPFASGLTYKLRVAELKQGQNPENAITRNNSMYRDDHVMTTGTVYPVTARPLQKWQPYVWTVDAYYKGVLLGGAEVWKFTIIDDSEFVGLPKESFFVDIRNEQDQTIYNAVGMMKIKYVEKEKEQQILLLTLKSEKGQVIRLKENKLAARLGDNRFTLNFKEDLNLKHMGKYELQVRNESGEQFLIPLRYINPDLVR